MSSGLPLKADTAQCSRLVSNVTKADLTAAIPRRYLRDGSHSWAFWQDPASKAIWARVSLVSVPRRGLTDGHLYFEDAEIGTSCTAGGCGAFIFPWLTPP